MNRAARHTAHCAAGTSLPICGLGATSPRCTTVHLNFCLCAAFVSDSDDPFPTLQFDDAPAWSWPMPPGTARRYTAPPPGAAQACRIETRNGLCLQGEMLDFDVAKRRLVFRTAPSAPQASLSFASVRRLTLSVPLALAPRAPGSPKERAAPGGQLRDYTLQLVGASDAAPTSAVPLTGQTTGHIEANEGLYLFSPTEDDGAPCRVFVPRGAYSRCEFGASAEELAARHWIASPAALLEALAQPARPAVMPLGQSLLALGLLRPAQLQRALQQMDGKTALGETLVAAGLVSRTDLQTALAHKMGYPFVDLQRFPIDDSALARLPRGLAIGHRVLPLMLDGERLVVAVDRPGRLLKLRELGAIVPAQIVPALALKGQILLAFNRQSEGWNLNPSERAAFATSSY